VTVGVLYGLLQISVVTLSCVPLSYHYVPSCSQSHQQAVPSGTSMRAEAQASRISSAFP